jgi:SAM-dependent methyltransferase
MTRYSERYFWDEYLPELGVGQGGQVDLDLAAKKYAPLLSLFEIYHPPPGDLLEIGTAAGLFMKSAERTGWRTKGVEPLAPAVAFARERLGLDVILGTLEEADLAPGSFDAVVMLDTIEHVPNPLHVLTSVHALMRQRGLLVLTTPNWEALSRHALGEQWAAISAAEHLYLFSEATLTATLKKAGFSWIHYQREVGGLPIQTMNADYTHAPGSTRHRVYREFVRMVGPFVFHSVQRRGLADQLVCIARA